METYKRHVEKLLKILTDKNLKAALVFNPANIFYFTGTDAPSATLIFEDSRVVSISSRLEYLRAVEEHLIGEVYAFSRATEVAEYEKIIQGDLYESIKKLLEGMTPERIGVVGGSADLRQKLTEKIGPGFQDLSREVSLLRRQKDLDELERIKSAIRIGEYAMSKALNALEKGVTEYEVVAEVLYAIHRNNATPSFDPIVAFGEHASHPHAKPSRRELQEGDVVKIDLGARVQGYCSDMTRTVIFGRVSTKQERIIKAVHRAQERAIEALRAGVRAREVHMEAYRILKEEGLHNYFNHGLGHGVGIEIHEEPYLNAETEAELLVGDIVTVEPGVYMAGYLGVRIEDMILVKEEGTELLTYFPKDYII
ncbi:M24 family metallopeptidase [Infirmifilum uzonense]|uniref:M24 family metallopeptidase n=1 Tax=Infirmifilum uzonense TaxID=1550241 RepID=UPI00069993E8|nr:Xaa-Pro peptidase family protein [Infirmifilum uzonense]